MSSNHTVRIWVLDTKLNFIFDFSLFWFTIFDFPQDIEELPVVNRLTDVSLYPISHKKRFDKNGRGLGLNGRREPNDVLSMNRFSPDGKLGQNLWKTNFPKRINFNFFFHLGILHPVPLKLGLTESELRRRKLSDEIIQRGTKIW